MKTIKEIRNKSGLSRSDFAAKYGIPIRTLEDWEAERRKCPSYLINLLDRAVAEDSLEVTVSCMDPKWMRELGAVYKKLCLVLNKDGDSPINNPEIRPLKSFTMVYPRAACLHIPKRLQEQITLLLAAIDDSEWDALFEQAVTAETRGAFLMGMSETWKI